MLLHSFYEDEKERVFSDPIGRFGNVCRLL